MKDLSFLIMKRNVITIEHVLKAVANRRRLEILRYLKIKKELTLDDVADRLELSFRSTSKHLIILSRSGLLVRKQKSRFVIYQLESNIPRYLQSLLQDL